MLNKATIIIPNFDSSGTIDLCLDSVINQSCKNYNIIVVDNNSTDDSVKKIKKYNVNLIYCNKQGPSAARNAGLRRAKTEIIIFIDADCVIPYNFVEKHISAHKKHDKICGSIEGINNNVIAIIDDLLAWNIFHPGMDSKYLDWCSTTNLSIKKSIINKFGPFNENLFNAEDVEFCKRIGKIYFDNTIKVYHINRTKIKGVIKRIHKWSCVKNHIELGLLTEGKIIYNIFNEIKEFITNPIKNLIKCKRYYLLFLSPFLLLNALFFVSKRLKERFVYRFKYKKN